MKVGLIGAGNIGQHFATRILAAGHELVNVTELQCIVKSCFCVVSMAVVCEIWFGRSHGKNLSLP